MGSSSKTMRFVSISHTIKTNKQKKTKTKTKTTKKKKKKKKNSKKLDTLSYQEIIKLNTLLQHYKCYLFSRRLQALYSRT